MTFVHLFFVVVVVVVLMLWLVAVSFSNTASAEGPNSSVGSSKQQLAAHQLVHTLLAAPG